MFRTTRSSRAYVEGPLGRGFARFCAESRRPAPSVGPRPRPQARCTASAAMRPPLRVRRHSVRHSVRRLRVRRLRVRRLRVRCHRSASLPRPLRRRPYCAASAALDPRRSPPASLRNETAPATEARPAPAHDGRGLSISTRLRRSPSPGAMRGRPRRAGRAEGHRAPAVRRRAVRPTRARTVLQVEVEAPRHRSWRGGRRRTSP